MLYVRTMRTVAGSAGVLSMKNPPPMLQNVLSGTDIMIVGTEKETLVGVSSLGEFCHIQEYTLMYKMLAVIPRPATLDASGTSAASRIHSPLAQYNIYQRLNFTS